MNLLISAIVGIATGVVIGFVAVVILKKKVAQKGDEVLAESKRKAEQEMMLAKEEAMRVKEVSKKELDEEKNELKQYEKRILKKEDIIEKRADAIQTREKQLETHQKELDARQKEAEAIKKELTEVIAKEREVLHKVSGLTKEDAAAMLLAKIEPEIEKEKSELIRKKVEVAKETAEHEAKRIITMAIQRYASEHTAHAVVTVVDLTNDEMKGRIIGREGRNIRAFERSTGVDVIVDDTPGSIVLSAFDGVRREMARRSMEKLILDGRIHPTRIEEIVEQTKKEMEEHINNVGKDVVREEELGNVHPKLITLIGRLKYRTSYGQNVLQHIREVAHLCSVMAAELGLNHRLARRAGLFHDIGKAVDQEMEGTHPYLGGELLKRFNEPFEVVDAAARHHEDAKAETPYTTVAAAADAISASRPGARSESIERYIKRLEQLETIAKSFPGVDMVYAVQAGREVRVLANADKVNDDQCIILARDIAKNIEKDMTYPGEIKVTVLREKRVFEYAR